MEVETVVLDTNIVLDVFVFNDVHAQPLRQALALRDLRWLATSAMRDELARVLTYPRVAPRLAYYQLAVSQVLESFDAHGLLVPPASKAGVTCSDPDDQPFIDLAVAHKAILLSKDRAILSMKKRLALLDVSAADKLADVARYTRKLSARALGQ